jgi:hypothetical protein
MADLRLAGSLAVPMEDAPTVVMPAVGADPYAFGSVSLYGEGPDGWTPERPWAALCAGPDESTLQSWHATSEAAQSAVEEHIAAQVDAHLSEVAR